MDLILIIGFAFMLVGLFYIVYELKNANKPKEDTAQKMMMDIVENLRKEMNESGIKTRQELEAKLEKMSKNLGEHQYRSSETMQKQFGQSSKLIEEVTKKLTQIDETNKKVVNFAEQMQSLENILKNPKQRGILGEYFLESLLSNVLSPNNYTMQYKFDNNTIVDAAIFYNDKIIPIDAKFSLDKYNMIMKENDKDKREQFEKEFKNALKVRIDETAKYIMPDKGTTDFAFMFIPAEGIYYNLLIYNVGSVEVNSQDLIKYAFSKHVIIVSPTSFYAYLQTVMQGLKALKTEESIKDVVKNVANLDKHLKSYSVYMQKMGNNLGTTVGMYNTAAKEFFKIDKDVYRITDGEYGSKVNELVGIEKPNETFVE